MAKKALFMGLRDNKIDPEELYNLDYETLFLKYSETDYKPFSLLKNISERKLYKMVLEIPFCNDNKNHIAITSLDKRYEKENEILTLIRKKYFSNFREESIIIDIPEKISFEVNLPVFDKNRFDNFTDSGSVFNETVIKGFTEALRKIRIFMPENICEKFSKESFVLEIAETLVSD
jgi:hypothetical protein